MDGLGCWVGGGGGDDGAESEAGSHGRAGADGSEQSLTTLLQKSLVLSGLLAVFILLFGFGCGTKPSSILPPPSQAQTHAHKQTLRVCICPVSVSLFLFLSLSLFLSLARSGMRLPPLHTAPRSCLIILRHSIPLQLLGKKASSRGRAP